MTSNGRVVQITGIALALGRRLRPWGDGSRCPGEGAEGLMPRFRGGSVRFRRKPRKIVGDSAATTRQNSHRLRRPRGAVTFPRGGSASVRRAPEIGGDCGARGLGVGADSRRRHGVRVEGENFPEWSWCQRFGDRFTGVAHVLDDVGDQPLQPLQRAPRRVLLQPRKGGKLATVTTYSMSSGDQVTR